MLPPEACAQFKSTEATWISHNSIDSSVTQQANIMKTFQFLLALLFIAPAAAMELPNFEEVRCRRPLGKEERADADGRSRRRGRSLIFSRIHGFPGAAMTVLRRGADTHEDSSLLPMSSRRIVTRTT